MGSGYIKLPLTGGGASSVIEYNAGNSGSSITIDWSNGVNQFLLLTANCTISFTNWTVGQNYALVLEQDDGGDKTPTLANVNFEGGVDPTWASTARNYNVLRIYYDGGGPAVSVFGPYLDSRFFVPTQLANCELFVMSTIPSTLPSASNGAAQTQWLDLSANAFVFQQTSGSAKPIYHSSGFGTKSIPYLHFDGSAQYMQTTANVPSSLATNPAYTEIVVFQGDNTSQDQPICGWGDGSGGAQGIGVYAPTGSNYQVPLGGAQQTVSGTAISTSPLIITITKAAGALTANTTMRINAAAQTLSGSANTPSIAAAHPFCIGLWANYTPVKLAGKIAGRAVFSRVLSGTEITKVETYFNNLAGIF